MHQLNVIATKKQAEWTTAILRKRTDFMSQYA